MMKILKTCFDSPLIRHTLFWISVLLYFVLTASMNIYNGYRQVIEFNSMVVFTQIVTAYTTIYILIPRFLNKKKTVLFAFWMLILLMAMFVFYNLFKIHYYDPTYYETYSDLGKIYANEPLLKRITRSSVFLSKCIKFLTPTMLLLVVSFYKNQQKFLKLNEQKKIAELSALKNQLNPHFLFNTLNNLYSLALEKSDKTPEVIERLSDILDYMLYRCKDKFVPLKKEIELIENYLSLEKIRYGKRVTITFNNQVNDDVRIAPLLLLTFIENAFKHGVSQTLKGAKIDISLTEKKDNIVFSIYNTKPTIAIESTKPTTEALGLKNVKQQLELLYPNNFDLQIDDKNDGYSVNLILNTF